MNRRIKEEVKPNIVGVGVVLVVMLLGMFGFKKIVDYEKRHR